VKKMRLEQGCSTQNSQWHSLQFIELLVGVKFCVQFMLYLI
jgi:hypothetical protein